MSFVRTVSTVSLILASVLSSALHAQGTDDCASPTAIVGQGPFNFSTVGASTGAQQSGACTNALRDVWFTWTAPTTSTYEVSTCGGTGMNTVIAVYAGNACPSGSALQCNDNACGTQSATSFQALAGNSYVIQIGAFNNVSGSGTFGIALGTSPACAITTGPDVIVGAMPDISNYTTFGGLDAISLGTTSCNLGTVNLNWFANTNQHPVIGGNLYRFKLVNGAGRFEQIGRAGSSTASLRSASRCAA